MEIRPATEADRDAFDEICLRTGDAGEDASGLHDDPRLLGAVYVGPYLALPGTVAFAGVDDHGVGAYVLGAIDTPAFEAACAVDWWPALRERYPEPPANPHDAALVAHIHRPPTTPAAVTDRYPAHLHIDLLPRLQGAGHGRRLIDALLTELAAAGAPGVHLGVAARNTRAIGFYEHLGFRTLHDGPDARLMGRRLPS